MLVHGLVPRDQQIQLGLQAAQKVYQQMPVLPDNSYETQYIRQLGAKLVSWLEAPPAGWQPFAAKSAARVKAELDWQPLCRKAVDFAETMCRRRA